MEFFDAQSVLTQYLKIFPDERSKVVATSELLNEYPSRTDFTRRDNMDGHLTVGGIIVDQTRKDVLLIQHTTLGICLPPGGHIEPSDPTPLQSILREIEEETGILPVDLELVEHCPGSPLVPIDINVHKIPANSSKLESEHDHHDLRYLFVYRGALTFPLVSPEVDANKPIEEKYSGKVDWYPKDEAFQVRDQSYLSVKLCQALKGLD